ncbi:MAG: thermonuclease family protein [Pseudomonadota bacterium]
MKGSVGVPLFFASGRRAIAGPVEGQRIIATSGDRFVVDGKECLLDDVVAPHPKRLSQPQEPYFIKARDMLQAFIDRDEILFHPTRRDRWGREYGRLSSLTDRTSAEQELIIQGAARVHPQSEDFGFIETLYEQEQVARRRERGLWALDSFRSLDATRVSNWSRERASPLTDRFQIFSGPLTSVAKRGGRTFFNFGRDYKSDVTATYVGRKKDLPILAFEGDLIGRQVEVRGYVSWINGPSLTIKHPLQIRAPWMA